jgi:hypothetical protein
MTLADLPVLNPSTPGREARRAGLVAALFAVFGALYALIRATANAPPLPSPTDPVFGFAYPRGWGVSPSAWSGAATWPSRLAAADLSTTLAVIAIVILAIALVIIMHPDILSRQGPQYVSPARRITTVAIAFVMAFVIYAGVGRVDDIFGTTIRSDPDRARRQLLGFAAVAIILFGGIWSFIGPKDFGRRIPLRIQHGAMGGLAVWAAITFATMLSSEPRSFLSGELDTFYTLLTIDAANGSPGATAGWALSSDVLTAAVAMAAAGALLIVTAPQSLGPGNRRGSALIVAILGAFLAVVAMTTWSVTQERARSVNFNVTEQLQLDKTAPTRAAFLLSGGATPGRTVYRQPVVPSGTADDCMHKAEDRQLPAATTANVQKLGAWLDAHGNEVTGAAIRVASCRAALQALRWDVESARASIFLSPHPERIGAWTYNVAVPNVSSATPSQLARIIGALGDNTRYEQGSQAAQRFADLARIAGDSAAESAWRQRIIQPSSQAAMATLLARPSYSDGSITGRIQAGGRGWRVGLLAAADPSMGAELNVPRGEGGVLASMISAATVASDGRFSFTGLRDGYYVLAVLAPETGTSLSRVAVKGDPGVFRLDPQHKLKDVGTVTVTF